MHEDQRPSLLVSVLMAALAGGLGWGIRGQYGHETGAMIAGLLVGLVFVLLHTPQATSLFAARTIGLFTLAIGVGGSMTYGQTIGLTHNPNMVGNLPALWWGMTGLAIKGSVWIGLGAAFLGLAWGGKRYSSQEWGLLLLCLLFALFLGLYAFNEPYDPELRVLPKFYFSASWYWDPTAVDLRPRRERWGGLWCLLIVLTIYARFAKGDKLCLRLALWGCLAGGIGFPLGQSVQAFHAWNAELFRNEAFWLHRIDGINWWNFMETIFGAAWGGILGLGVWLNRDAIVVPEEDTVELAMSGEWLTMLVHAVMVFVWNFGTCLALDEFAGHGFTMIILPAMAITGGRVWPYWMVLPITLLPIAVKTGQTLAPAAHECFLHCLNLHDPAVDQITPKSWPVEWMTWGLCVVLPMILTATLAQFAVRSAHEKTSQQFTRWALPFAVWIYYLLNHSFFGNPFPTGAWTGRSPNDLIFLLCAIGLTIGAWVYGTREIDESAIAVDD